MLRRSSAPAVVSWLLAAIVGQVLITSSGSVLPFIGGIVWLFAIPSAASAIEARRTARQFSTRLSHVLSDVVRRRGGERGSGAALLSDVMTAGASQNWTIGGVAANTELLERVYRPLGWHATDQRRFHSPMNYGS